MAGIPASLVVKLRKMSGQGMMDCKRALEEANGNIEEAMSILRKKGLATLAKRAERETTEGMVILTDTPNGKFASLAALCCETDFVARSDPFSNLYNFIKQHIEKQKPDNIESILKASDNLLTETISKTGEKLTICNPKRYWLSDSEPGLIGTYLHFNGKVGSMVKIETDNDATAQNALIKKAASDIAMHIAATKPLALDRNGNDAKVEDWSKVIEQEKSIYADQVKNKPANIVDKIVEGKLKKFYEENCLLEQKFVKDDTKTVAQVLDEAAKQAGGKATITGFERCDIG
jgi:elongation factor Ts